MKNYINTIGSFILFSVILNTSYAQVPTYTIDQTFNTGEVFQDLSPVIDFHSLSDGRILVGGGFINNYGRGMGMVYSNGQYDDDWGWDGECNYYHVMEIIAQEDGYIWPTIYSIGKIDFNGVPWFYTAAQEGWGAYFIGGTSNPYIVERVWDIYQLENGDLLLGCAIATDTLQPYLFRGLTRLHADGSHDPTFPIINITPNNGSGAVRTIFSAPDSSWYVSGSFTALNGHHTNHVAHLTPDFQVDTTFVSPFMYDGPVGYTEDIILVDDQSRVWVSGYDMRLIENPNDTIQLCRLLPDGTIDPSFPLVTLRGQYPDEWMGPKPHFAHLAQELEAHPGNYLIYGSFSHYNDTMQNCIAVVNEDGVIQDNFFQGQGATINQLSEGINDPGVYIIEEQEDGSLLVGGEFSQFMGETYYNVIKLKPDILDAVPEVAKPARLSVYPNPANTYIEFEYELLMPSEQTTLRIIDMQGKPVHRWNLGRGQRGMKVLDTRELPNGAYVYELIQRGEKLNSGKFIIQH